MSINTAIRNDAVGNLAGNVASDTVSFATGTFLENYGNAVGIISSLAWIGVSILIIYLTIIDKKNTEDPKDKINKLVTYVCCSIVIIGTILNNYFFITSDKKKEDRNSIYSNVALIPLYITIAVIVIGIMMSLK